VRWQPPNDDTDFGGGRIIRGSSSSSSSSSSSTVCTEEGLLVLALSLQGHARRADARGARALPPPPPPRMLVNYFSDTSLLKAEYDAGIERLNVSGACEWAASMTWCCRSRQRCSRRARRRGRRRARWDTTQRKDEASAERWVWIGVLSFVFVFGLECWSVCV
jgi:hypothetical protein